MLAAERQRLIVEEVRRRDAVKVSELTELLGVSDMTVRRDLEALAGSGLIDKVHGGATARRSLSTGFDAKSGRRFAEEEAIAQAAAALVEPGQAIALSAGTTTWRLAHHLADVPDLTVVTNSMQVAIALRREARQDLTLVLIGGVRVTSDALVGPIAVNALGSLHVNLLFMGVHGMAVDAGFTTPNLLEADTNRALIASAEQLAVVVDHTKWGIRGLSRLAKLGEAQLLITDEGLAAEARTVLSEHVGRLIVAPTAR